PNARTGMKSVFAAPGTFIPGKKTTLSRSVIRGVESSGMLCSGAELEISADHEGILDLPEEAPVGGSFAEWAKLDDPVIEINLLPNRPDAAGVDGIARDLAAAGLGSLKTPPVPPLEGRFPCPVSVRLDFAKDDAHLAPLFALRLVKDVRNGPSPEWMQRRLKAIGLRPINALVDITNYLTFDRARPLHVFDAKKVKGNLTVRRARPGEKLAALDGRTYELDSGNVVIAGEAGVESLAGIIGGEATGCDQATTDVLIESAVWDPVNIARSGRRLNIASDARYRFERGVDPAFCLPGLELAARLVTDICGGVASAACVAGREPRGARSIIFPWSEFRRLTGLSLSEAEMEQILESLGFTVTSAAGNPCEARVTAPSFRHDIESKTDLVEEILRIAGVDRVAPVPLSPSGQHAVEPALTLLQKRAVAAKRALAANGLIEAVTWSFIARERAKAFGGGAPELVLANPIAPEHSDMRPSLLPGLIAAAQRNADRGHGDAALFEVGQIFLDDSEGGQKTAASAIRRGMARERGIGRHWSLPNAPAGLFDVKADALALLSALGLPSPKLQFVPGAPPWFHPGRSATIQLGPKNVLGAFGELHPRTLEAIDAEGPVAGFELILDDIPAPKLRATKTKLKLELPEFMPVQRDFAFLASKDVKAADIVKAAAAADRALVADASVFDVYEGPGIEEGKKSVAVAVTLQPRERTLMEAEIDSVSAKIVAEVARKTGASLRG
ncbi:MAG: phenylalanine--tRNA ligase subunit beta, partial [Methylocapsa sp.]|nr:phenylalanine--tRNA ligase subunit beta [Methylocapsa sp.]